MSFNIRPYQASDADWVLACQIALQEHEIALHDSRGPALPHTHDYLAMLWENIAGKQGVMLIGTDKAGARLGLAAGYVAHEPWPMEVWDSSHYGLVSDVFVVPEARGSGLAQALIDALADHLHRADPRLTRLRINALAVNAMATRAYAKAGFAPYEIMFERPLGPRRSQDPS
ncbi:MAG: GNAT family N-acetyltransferase [Rhodospirillaceae bacterium]|nr:GNAT family N-acetyltransferase [Rhodospirillaceae bacterium]